MWIMLTEKLPVDGSPPKMSLHWSIDGADVNKTNSQFKRYFPLMQLAKRGRYKFDRDNYHTKIQNFYWDDSGNMLSPETIERKTVEYMRIQDDTFHCENEMIGDWGEEDNWAKSRWILYNGENFRVFPREYSVMEKENMYLYLGLRDTEASHELVPVGAIGRKQAFDLDDTSLKDIYDAAVVDGATHEQATAMALGLDVTNLGELSDIPVSGWYRIKPQYGLIYCDPPELL